MDSFSDYTARALVPEHLAHYVLSLSFCTPLRIDDFLAWKAGSSLILIGYPREERDFFSETSDIRARVARASSGLDRAIAKALELANVDTVTVLAPARPTNLPQNAQVHEDMYQGLALENLHLSGKLANMLRRAERDIVIETGSAWSREHDVLLANAVTLMRKRPGERQLSSDSALLFSRMPNLVRQNPGNIVLYSARRRDNQALAGLVVGDHASYTTSFYLFALKTPDAPPGTADALLNAFLQNSLALGQIRCNLGLSINEGIRFFKGKWRALPWFPLFECSFKKPQKGFFARLFGRS